LIDNTPYRKHIGAVKQDILLGVEVLVGDKLHSEGVIEECISGYPCCGLVGFGEAAVDNDHLAVSFDRVFSVYFLHRGMAIDDPPLVWIKIEFREHLRHMALSSLK